MLNDAFGSRSGGATGTPSSDSGYALFPRADGNDLIAWQGHRPILREQFLSEAAALAARLPARKHVLNLCTDRYRFMVGFAASLCRGQISLMPPNDMPSTLKALASGYPDIYAIADTTSPPLPTIVYPTAFDPPLDGTMEVPIVESEQPAVILFTSGSTGRPRPVPKSWGTLVRSAISAGNRLGLARFGGGAVIGTVPHQHSYGLESVIFLALQHGLAVVAERPFYPADIESAIEAAPRPRILVTTPVHLRSLVAEPYALPAVDLIVSATAPLSAELAAKAEERFQAPLIEIYGCTEAGQIATRRTILEAQWRCLDDVILQRREDCSWVAGGAVPTPTPLQDVIEHMGSDTFLLTGRSAELVDVAGKHTTLSHLNHQLLTIDGVKDGIFVVPDAGEQRVSRLLALVVAPGLRADAILGALRERVDAAFLPRPLILVGSLPRNALGKLSRETVLQLVHQNRFG